MAIRVIVLEPGECATIPDTANIVSIVATGGGQVESDCSNTPAVSDYNCWKFFWSSDTFDSDSVFTKLVVGDNTYNVPSAYADAGDIDIAEWINTDPIFSGLVVLGCSDKSGIIVYNLTLKIKVPDGISAPELFVKNPNPGEDVEVIIRAVEDDDCDSCS